jgi:DNA-binding NarL/FixJ family response regulator
MNSLLIVDDHPIIRDALKTYFKDFDHLTVKGEAENGKMALELLAQHQYDLVITDISMPEMSGTELMEKIKADYPSQKVLVVSMINETSSIKKMISLGANGYVLKHSPKDEIIMAIGRILEGDNYFDEDVYQLIMSDIAGKRAKQRLTVEAPLTKRENEILKLIMDEKTNQEVADQLFISTRTVEAHKRNLLEKTGCKTVAGLAIYAMEKGLI